MKLSALPRFLFSILIAIVFVVSFVSKAGAFTVASSDYAKPCKVHVCEKILTLPEGAPIPLEGLTQATVNGAGEALISRIREQEKAAPDLISPFHVPLDFEKDVQIMLFFWVEDLESIQARGFLNQHQIKKSNGTFNPSSRLNTEDNIMGLKLGSSEESLALRPKSAFLNVLTQVDLGPKIRGVVSDHAYDPPQGQWRGGYGNVAAVFKNSVRSRSLWTADDSWWLGMETRTDRELLPLRGTFDRGSLPKRTLEKNSYFEALIFGNIGVDDVEYFITLNDSVVPNLKVANKPIYLAARSIEFGRYVFQRTQLLYVPAQQRASSN